jgi:transcriptional regulator with XRE-family HTH domain
MNFNHFGQMSEKQYRDQSYLIRLGNHLKSIREIKGLTQEGFAELCDIDTRQIRRIERAETNSTISILKKIADKLGITVNELLNF